MSTQFKLLTSFLFLLITLIGCKKDDVTKPDQFEGEWYLKTKVGSTDVYTRKEVGNTFTGLSLSTNNTLKTKIKIIKTVEGKYLITIPDVSGKVLEARIYTSLPIILLFTNISGSGLATQQFTFEPVLNSTKGYYVKSGNLYLGATYAASNSYFLFFSETINNSATSFVWELEP